MFFPSLKIYTELFQIKDLPGRMENQKQEKPLRKMVYDKVKSDQYWKEISICHIKKAII